MQRETATTSGAQEAARMWEYKMSDDGEVFGPYTEDHMREWYNQGYFQGDNVALVRRVGEDQFVWSHSINFNELPV